MPGDPEMTFAATLNEFRTAAGLTQAELAKNAGVEFSALREWLAGRRMPSFAAVLKLAKALGKDCTAFAQCEDLVGDGGEPPAKKGGTKPAPKKRSGRKPGGSGR